MHKNDLQQHIMTVLENNCTRCLDNQEEQEVVAAALTEKLSKVLEDAGILDVRQLAIDAGVVLRLDGNAWCATGPNFDCLATSPAGFGDTEYEAVVNLLKETL
jgi:hypothetical protein